MESATGEQCEADAEVIYERSTGTAVRLAGLSPAERLLCMIDALVDPHTFRGRSASACLIGQVGIAYREQHPMAPRYCEDEPELVARVSGVPVVVVERIYIGAEAYREPEQFEDARSMARGELDAWYGVEEAL